MSDTRKSLSDRIVTELRAIRKLPGALDARKLSSTAAILKGLGGGDAEEALERLVNVARLHRDNPQICAAFASLGFETASGTVLGRLQEFADDHFIDTRTARRWSDTGIETLSRLVMGTEPWAQPAALLNIGEYNPTERSMLIWIQLLAPLHARMNHPTLTINGSDMVFELQKMTPTGTGGDIKSEPREIAVPDNGIMLMRFNWRGNQSPRYSLLLAPNLPWRIHTMISLRTMEIRFAAMVESTRDGSG